VKQEERQDKMMKTKTLITTLAVAGALIAGTTAVKANPELELISGSNSVTLTAGNSTGQLTFIGSVGQWNLNVTTGENDLGGPNTPIIDVNSVDTATGYKGALLPLEILYTAGGYTHDGSVVGSIGGTTTTTVSDQQYLGWSAFDLSHLLTSIGPLSPGIGDLFGGYAYGTTGNTDGPYWLTEVVTIGGAARGTQSSSFDARTAVPDGGTTMVLLGSALACLGAIRSRRGAKRG
jgi:hypothetical protein